MGHGGWHAQPALECPKRRSSPVFLPGPNGAGIDSARGIEIAVFYAEANLAMSIVEASRSGRRLGEYIGIGLEPELPEVIPHLLTFGARKRNAFDEIALSEEEQDQHRQNHHGRGGHQQVPLRGIEAREFGEPECQRVL